MTIFQKIFIGFLSFVMLCLVAMMTGAIGWYVVATFPAVAAEASTATPESMATPTYTLTPTTTPILIPPTATHTPTPSTISGQLTGPEGPIVKAKISLETYGNEECIKLANSTVELSEQEKKQLEDCH